MAIYLGNLSVSDMEQRLGVVFPEELKIFMRETRQELASELEKNKWHCFDCPFILVCENKEMAEKIYSLLLPQTKNMKTQLNISWHRRASDDIQRR
jgi:hypothetical protein